MSARNSSSTNKKSSSSFIPVPPAPTSSRSATSSRHHHHHSSMSGAGRHNILQMIKKTTSPSSSLMLSARGAGAGAEMNVNEANDHNEFRSGQNNNNNNTANSHGGNQQSNLLYSADHDGALSGLHLAIRYTLPRLAFNANFSGTVAAMNGYNQPTRTQVTRESSAFYTCLARREPTVGTNHRVEVVCAGTSSGSVVFWRYRLSHRLNGVPPPANTMTAPLVLGAHKAGVTSVAFYDDTVLVTGSSDCNLCLWDVHLQYISTEAPGFRGGSRCIQTVVAHESSITAVAVHGPWIVSAGSKDGTIKVWGCAPGREKLSFPFLVPLQVIVLESRITAMHCGELRAVEGVVPDVVVATADGNLTMFRSTEEALTATSNGSVQNESIAVFKLAKQIRTHYPEGASSIMMLMNNNNNNNNNNGKSNANNNNNNNNQDGISSTGFVAGGSITSIVPLSELNTVISIGYSSSCFARDSLNFSVMNTLNHPDVNTMTNPGNAVRFVHCAYDSKKEEILLIDSLGEVFVWSTKSARIVFRTRAVVGAFFALAVGERGFWIAGRRDIQLIRIEREEHRLEHPIHRERVLSVSLAPSREWWSLSLVPSDDSSPASASSHFQKQNLENNNINNPSPATQKQFQELIGQQQLEDITPWLITASVDNTVKVWNCNMKCMHTCKEKRSELSSFAVLKTQAGFVVSGHEDGCVKLWALTSTASNNLKVQSSLAPASLQNMNSGSNTAASTIPTLPPINNNNGNPQQHQQQYISATEAFSQDVPSNSFHFTAHSNTVSVVGEGLHRRNPFDQSRFEHYPHLFSASYDGTLATWVMPTMSGAKVKCEGRVKCSDSEIVCAVYDPVQYCYWVGTNRGEVTAWSIDELKPVRRLSVMTPAGMFPSNANNHNNNTNYSSLFVTNTTNFKNNNGMSSGGAGGLLAHSEAVTSISLDANYIFTGSEDGTIRMWNGVTGELHHKKGFEYDDAGVKILRGLLLSQDDDDDDDDEDEEDGDDNENAADETDDDGYGKQQKNNTSFEEFLARGGGEKKTTAKKKKTLSSNNKNPLLVKSKRNRGIKLAGDVHHMFVDEETGHLIVGTRRGVVTIFDQATGKAIAIGTTNKSHQIPLESNLANNSSSNSGSNNNNNKNQTVPTSTPSSARPLNSQVISPRQQQQIQKLLNPGSGKEFIRIRRIQQERFKQKISQEVSCLVLCTEKQEMIAGLGNGSVVRLALSALRKVIQPPTHDKNNRNSFVMNFNDDVGVDDDDDDQNPAFFSNIVSKNNGKAKNKKKQKQRNARGDNDDDENENENPQFFFEEDNNNNDDDDENDNVEFY